MRRDIRVRIKRAVSHWAASADQREGILEALRSEAYPLHRYARLRAGALSGISYDLLGGTDPDLRAWAGAIAELFMASGFLLDDAMDEEAPAGSSVGSRAALGLGSLLISQACLDDVGSHLSPEDRFSLGAEARRLVLLSCAGQQREIELRGSKDRVAAMSSDDAMRLTEMKAGALGELCAVIGAGIAGRLHDGLTRELRRCYRHLFTYRQILDDLADAAPSTLNGSSDIGAASPTLPVVYFLKANSKLGVGTHAERRGIASTMKGRGERGEADAPTEDDLRSTGTILFSELAAEMQRNRAEAIALKLHRRSEKANALLTMIGATPREGGGPKRHSGAAEPVSGTPD